MVGIGIDIIESSRFRGKKYTRDSALVKRMFTPHELKYCFSKQDPAQHLAARFAAKEAAWKALSGTKGLPSLPAFLQEVEILHGPDGKPAITFSTPCVKKITAMVSLSHTHTSAVAVVLVTR
ncbi:holo-[acyl-carrier-protein] synthase [Candidatus Kaiserbacteria bacterium RIFCSPLOWO2_02_FULL_55_12]|uniref:Holo-[acyl-carrier-protein] synthase n=2 Tax=Candidatus Kaiseribacteriota TaxID=1752734 RepID=A0A1F6F2W4_9BACT|nr:MAG: holo-[acyl-carrier-protein] synthase [Candidatus Kaiserbacteria bacterium RIFCSPHIGHO2_02_FULL_55_17]OGG80210.1 MAG: holo-[acyl-carrier-protein] synthase [Candidatus Kaiserbacteria bacterium RIFCSPLOWO2_02_FULL_55_12]